MATRSSNTSMEDAYQTYPKHSMGLAYIRTLAPQTTPIVGVLYASPMECLVIACRMDSKTSLLRNQFVGKSQEQGLPQGTQGFCLKPG